MFHRPKAEPRTREATQDTDPRVQSDRDMQSEKSRDTNEPLSGKGTGVVAALYGQDNRLAAVPEETQKEDDVKERQEESKESSEPQRQTDDTPETEQTEQHQQPEQATQEEEVKIMAEENQNDKSDTTAQQQTQPAAAQGSAPAGSSFARPGQPAPTRVPGSFGYPGAAYAGTSAAGSESPSTNHSNRKLIVGEGISMSGEIEACDHLIVEGKVEAALKGANMLDIAETGVFYGTVEIDEATVAGRFEGDLTVNGRLTVRSGGSITGAIAYGELEVEAGATIDGKLSPLKNRGGLDLTSGTKNKSETSKKDSSKSTEDIFEKQTAAAQ